MGLWFFWVEKIVGFFPVSFHSSSTDLGRAGLRDLVGSIGVELEDGGDSGANVLKLGRVLVNRKIG